MVPVQTIGAIFVFIGIALSGVQMGVEEDDMMVAIGIPISFVLFMILLWFVDPSIPSALAYIAGAGGWIFYIMAIIASIVFASRILVIG